MELPSEDVMRMLAQEALRKAMQQISQHLREFANAPGMDMVSGRDALLAAADAMLNTNDKTWGMKQ